MKNTLFLCCLFLFTTIATFSQNPFGKVLYLNEYGTQVWGFLPSESFQNGAWTLTGNSITETNFLGTANLSDLIFRTNNIERMRILSTGNLSITGNVLPSGDATYNLGSSSLRWKDLYLSGSTINLGSDENNAKISLDVENSNFNFSRGISINGKLVLSFRNYDIDDNNEANIDGDVTVSYVQSNGDENMDLIILPETAIDGQLVIIFYNPCLSEECGNTVRFYPVEGFEGDDYLEFYPEMAYSYPFTFVYFNGMWHLQSTIFFGF